MAASPDPSGWNILPPATVPAEKRLEHLRHCSDFASDLLARHPDWRDDLDEFHPPTAAMLTTQIDGQGLERGLRLYRNRTMLRIIWRDLCGLATLGETFTSLTQLAELCLQAAIDEHGARLQEKYGRPCDEDGAEQKLFVIGLGKFGGAELNLSSDIDVMFCYPRRGSCDGPRELENDRFFTRLARRVIASLSDLTEDGFCFRVDARLRPFGDSGPLTSSMAALEQYYQREGRDWERYALVKARPVAGDLQAGKKLMENLRPFVYRRYIDYGAVEALQEMHANVVEDARRKDREDDIKRGPGGIREIEFLTQCFQILRGGRETGLQTTSLDEALCEIERLGLLSGDTVTEIRHDYVFLRLLENRIQAQRDQQTHRIPPGEDRERIARAMYERDTEGLERSVARTRKRVSKRFHDIFPSRPPESSDARWVEEWRRLQADRQGTEPPDVPQGEALANFLRRLDRVALSQRGRRRLDRFMPELLERLDRMTLADETVDRAFDLVLAVCRRSAYLALLIQHAPALDRMLKLFDRSPWISEQAIRFPALLDELIDPSLGRRVPAMDELSANVQRLLAAAQGTEAVLEGLNYLRLASALSISVGHLQGSLSSEEAQQGLSNLAVAVLRGVLVVAGREIEERHGGFPDPEPAAENDRRHDGSLAIIGYGTLGARELGYRSDLDIVFLFETRGERSDGARPLPPERYYARLAQRVLSFLTIMTPSGRLYEVDTRLRPNGRAGALVSSIKAFHEYQLKEAWTWELQALTRARFVAGNRRIEAQFKRIRQDVLCRERDATKLVSDLFDMRHRMSREHEADPSGERHHSPKQQPGGLIDIEFIAQLGVLLSARAFPRVLQATGTLEQLRELDAIGWLRSDEAAVLERTLRALQESRMMAALLEEPQQPVDSSEAARFFEQRFGDSPR
ncbi:MAG: bifunctional [glutamate--ammonia ligase]-adenylyl-L-tyrosine phosphorylase/[glutamate--ammonia-ligase] adenylyltransferase [Xanthomonadales bacterium]|nr:bifunctional [glutamate--ammonia ligase]-adenylyl-L-tyrosine phosphorylase/[glutamate--ammonia-ligase] adenylyltransferase [Xanthomonadales bacterium]